MAVRAGNEAVAARGWFCAHRWLIARRISQLTILALFLLGPWAGIWIVKGNLSASETLDVLPLTDPYVLAQTLLAGHIPEVVAFAGAAIVLVFYVLVGGRAYCAWVCPINAITDAAAWLRERFNIKGSSRLSNVVRYWVLAVTFLLAAVTGTAAWELINPVSSVYRALVFGFGLVWTVVLGIFLFDLLIVRRGWCGHLCPVGAFYSLFGRLSLLRVSAERRAQCDGCLDCFVVCPEPQVIRPALNGADQGFGPVILSPNCTNCGRCIEVCDRNVFQFSTRFANRGAEVGTS